ncbi:MAG: EpsI family protein [Azoarcus sp.]|jgi:EpsI family protein|nr:EpsI family protein [Azoarcus sp.]
MRVSSFLLCRASLLAVLMCTASILAYFLTPSLTLRPDPIDLENLIPHRFGEWHVDETTVLGIINPQLKEKLTRIYSQSLSRTYVNHEGRRIMLSIAYGADQSIENRIHRPEVCYPAQGFLLLSQEKTVISRGALNIPAMRLITEAGNRHEPLTYWIRFGDAVIRGSLEQSLARIRYGLQGSIPDGLLFRVSEVNQDTQQSFMLQDKFIISLLDNLTPEAKKTVIGSSSL